MKLINLETCPLCKQPTRKVIGQGAKKGETTTCYICDQCNIYHFADKVTMV